MGCGGFALPDMRVRLLNGVVAGHPSYSQVLARVDHIHNEREHECREARVQGSPHQGDGFNTNQGQRSVVCHVRIVHCVPRALCATRTLYAALRYPKGSHQHEIQGLTGAHPPHAPAQAPSRTCTAAPTGPHHRRRRRYAPRHAACAWSSLPACSKDAPAGLRASRSSRPSPTA